MSTRTRQFFSAGCLFIFLFFCLAGVTTVSWYKKTTECFKDRPPLRGFVLTINRGQQKLLVEQSQKFANGHEFKFDVVYYTPQGNDFLIDLIRKDVEVAITNTSFDLNKFYISFVNYDCIHPTVASDIGGLYNDLKSLISEIPDAKLTEEK